MHSFDSIEQTQTSETERKDREPHKDIDEDDGGFITGKDKKLENRFLDISLKSDIRPINLLCLPYISFFTTNLVGFFNT